MQVRFPTIKNNLESNNESLISRITATTIDQRHIQGNASDPFIVSRSRLSHFEK
jgi:hypothetical protein